MEIDSVSYKYEADTKKPPQFTELSACVKGAWLTLNAPDCHDINTTNALM